MRAKTYIYGLIIFCLAVQIVKAQEFQGKAIYQSKTSINLDLDGRNIPEEQKQRIKERMKSAMERSYELTFDLTTSTYEEEERLEAPGNNFGGGPGFRMAFVGGGSGKYYKNIVEQNYLQQSELFGKVFLIQDSLTSWEWQLGSETKKIGNYTCYKATVTLKQDSTMFERMRNAMPPPPGPQGPNKPEKKKDTIQKDSVKRESMFAQLDAPRERVITAWYTPEIPVSQGPAEYWGLPGLILEVNDGRTAILCSKLILNPEEKVKIQAPTKGKKVSQEEYDEIAIKKAEEMSERFRNNRRGEGGRIRIRG